MQYDIAIVGAGILGLAHALAAARKGLRAVVVDRDAFAAGASIRNFGFITVTGQQQGECWRRAMRSRDVWEEIAGPAGIAVIHRGLAVAARRPEAAAVLEAFAATEMGEACALLSTREATKRFPCLTGEFRAALYSPHELRVESRDAIPLLAAWLEREHHVSFVRETAVHHVETGRLETARGTFAATHIVVCPGDDLATLFPDRLAYYRLQRCRLQMLRLRPRTNVTLGAAFMTDLSLARYLGYAELPEAAALRARLQTEQPAHLAAGVHLIAVQSADCTLVVGDTHEYGRTVAPFASETFDALVLEEFHALFPGLGHDIAERWIGTYASADDRLAFIDAPLPNVRLAVVTSGTGASTSFAIAEETIEGLLS